MVQLNQPKLLNVNYLNNADVNLRLTTIITLCCALNQTDLNKVVVNSLVFIEKVNFSNHRPVPNVINIFCRNFRQSDNPIKI